MARVYIVDDDDGTRETLTCGVRLAGYDAWTARSGRRGLQMIARRLPDALVVDLRLGDMTGLEMIDHLRSQGIRLPFILVSGFATVQATVEAMKLGALDVLEKPLSIEALVGALQRALASQLPHDAASDVHADSYRRWAEAVAALLDAPRDPKTIAGWSAWLGVSPETLRGWCRFAGLRPKASLDMARVLRAVHQAARRGVPPKRFFDGADRRTLQRLLSRGGVDPDRAAAMFELVVRQRFVSNRTALEELLRHPALAASKNPPVPALTSATAGRTVGCASLDPGRTPFRLHNARSKWSRRMPDQ